MSPAQTANLMAILGETLARSGLSTRAECCASIGWNYAQQYAAAIEADEQANAATALFTSHGYFVPPDSPSARLEQAGVGDRVGAVRPWAV